MNNYSYDDYVKKYSNSFVRVLLDNNTISDVQCFVEKLIIEKAKEEHHKIDGKKESKRFTTGILGEAAIEKFLGIKIRNWSSIGHSNLFNYPDIPGYEIGIKTVEFGKFPIIFKKNWYSQIICIRGRENPNLFFICGLATPDILNQYQDENLILDHNLKARGTKTGFYGFKYLKPIKSIKDLDCYKR